MKKRELRSDCPINYALENLGDKWTLLVIRDLVFEGKRFYKEFLESEEGIATNILSDRLKKLEGIGVIESRINEQQKTQKIYSLTAKGKDLIPLLIEMILWSSKHKGGLNISNEIVENIKKNKQEVIRSIAEHVGEKTYSSHK